MFDLGTFTSAPDTCEYLRDRPAQSLYRLVLGLEPQEYSELLAAGWRRFGRVIFRPVCQGCRECVPIRVPLEAFSPGKTQRRVWRRNADVEWEIGEPEVDDERIDLYLRHHAEREATRGWRASRMDPEEYFAAFVTNSVSTLEFRYRLEGRLVGVSYVGEASDALNSIYGFTDPEFPKRRLGVFDVLCEIEAGRRLGKKHLYLGFLVSGCSSMEYKASFRPYELLEETGWTRVKTDA